MHDRIPENALEYCTACGDVVANVPNTGIPFSYYVAASASALNYGTFSSDIWIKKVLVTYTPTAVGSNISISIIPTASLPQASANGNYDYDGGYATYVPNNTNNGQFLIPSPPSIYTFVNQYQLLQIGYGEIEFYDFVHVTAGNSLRFNVLNTNSQNTMSVAVNLLAYR